MVVLALLNILLTKYPLLYIVYLNQKTKTKFKNNLPVFTSPTVAYLNSPYNINLSSSVVLFGRVLASSAALLNYSYVKCIHN